MGRGLGKTQRAILDELDTQYWTPINDVFGTIYPETENEGLTSAARFGNRSKAQAFYRAIRTLEKRGLIETRKYMTVARVTETEFLETTMIAELYPIQRPFQLKMARKLKT